MCIAAGKINPQVTVKGQVGTHQTDDVKQIVAFIPYVSSSGKVLAIDTRGMINKADDIEINAGVVAGSMFGKNAGGRVFAHYDYRKIKDAAETSSSNYFSGLTIGCETYYKNAVAKMNVFIPLHNDPVQIMNPGKHLRASQFTHLNENVVQAKAGVNLDVGCNLQLTQHIRQQFLLGGYRYGFSEANNFTGMRISSQISANIKKVEISCTVAFEHDTTYGNRTVATLSFANSTRPATAPNDHHTKILHDLQTAPNRDIDIRTFHTTKSTTQKASQVETEVAQASKAAPQTTTQMEAEEHIPIPQTPTKQSAPQNVDAKAPTIAISSVSTDANASPITASPSSPLTERNLHQHGKHFPPANVAAQQHLLATLSEAASKPEEQTPLTQVSRESSPVIIRTPTPATPAPSTAEVISAPATPARVLLRPPLHPGTMQPRSSASDDMVPLDAILGPPRSRATTLTTARSEITLSRLLRRQVGSEGLREE